MRARVLARGVQSVPTAIAMTAITPTPMLIGTMGLLQMRVRRQLWALHRTAPMLAATPLFISRRRGCS